MTASAVLLPEPRHVWLSPVERVPVVEPVVLGRSTGVPPQGYRLSISADGVALTAADDAGEFYGRATLRQLAHGHGGELPVGTVEDWPDLPTRGVMLDISRDKVPTMATLFDLIDRLASWKINQVQLYTEHAFAYADHRDVWADASPMTAEEIRELDAFCRERFVELVPNQNCLGHWERWLRLPRYRSLALAPDGFEHQGRRREPTTLDPTKPESLAIVRSLLGELLPNFTSGRVHVGLDEPWELPSSGIDDYLAWAGALRALPELDGREMLVWGDILDGQPSRLSRLPEGVTICEWGYEDWAPFGERGATYASLGVPFWVCPGTSSWLTLLGRWTNMVRNNRAAARAAVEHGASGYLVTDWGDMGHLQYLPVSEPGFAYAAAVSWCGATNLSLDLETALDLYAFDDPSRQIGAALHGLADAHLALVPQFPNLATAVLHLYFPHLDLGRGFTRGIDDAQFTEVETRLGSALERLNRCAPRRADGALVVDELRAGAALMLHACRDAHERLRGDGSFASLSSGARASLGDALAPLIEQHRALWLARNRPGGLDDSCSWLERLRSAYLTGTIDRTLGGW